MFPCCVDIYGIVSTQPVACYGTGVHFCPAMYTMLGEIKRWTPEQIMSKDKYIVLSGTRY